MKLSARWFSWFRVALFIGLFSIDIPSSRAVSLLWDASPSPNVVGYAVYYGYRSGDYSTRIDAGNELSISFQPENGKSNYFFVVTAYTSDGLESLPSNELNYQPQTVQVTSGSYNGLFAGAPPAENPGSFSLRKSAGDGFSGLVSWLGQRLRFAGKFDSNGVATVSIARKGTIPLLLSLHLDSSDSNRLLGKLSVGDWNGQLSSDRLLFNARTNPAPYTGKYTFAILGMLGESLAADGIGSGSIRVLPGGVVRTTGTLGDGKRFANSTFLSADGTWPLYVAPYGRFGGLFSGWLKFETNGTDSIHGDLSWVKPSNPKEKLYPAGFTNSVSMIGSSYLWPTNKGEPVLTFSNGTFTLSGGGLDPSLAKDVVLSSNKLLPAVVGDDRFTFRIQKSVGLFDGRISLPGYAAPVRFVGSLLQNQNAAYGLFLKTNQTGEVRLEPAP